MTDTPSPEHEAAPTDDDALRKRLLGRVAVAAVVIVALLGSLAIFDAMNAPPPEPAPLASVTSPPAEAKPAEADTAKPAEADAAKPADTDAAKSAGQADTTAKPETVAAAPEGTSAPDIPPLPPLPPEKALTKPATGRQASIKPSEQLLPALPTRPDARREIAGATRGESMKPLAQQRGLPATRQFALQLGVFKDLANAEDLRARLEVAGIPASIEARVQVGPFNSRAEIDAARDKLRQLGMDPGIVVSLKRQ